MLWNKVRIWKYAQMQVQAHENFIKVNHSMDFYIYIPSPDLAETM